MDLGFAKYSLVRVGNSPDGYKIVTLSGRRMARSSAPCTHRLVQVSRAGHEGVSTGHIHDPQWRYDLTTPIFRGVPGNIVALAHLCAGANGGHGSPRRRIESFSPLPRALATAAPMMATSCANVLERTAPHIASGHHLAVLPEARSTLAPRTRITACPDGGG